ncbi:hypothetical protein CBW65_18060 [Tumebacillus avium]|uniref:EVE domain-containing protein n=1 Tax=Tumebacillus avium TaxID=1903704 RepID=A0A1Y0IS70_9BACL|nr:hypothetical protein [Tumebacillus avium]ARU62666.1 hypothetical protein CBW65_18060 [Tumebacillus avium]
MEYEKGYIGVTSWEWFEFLRDSKITNNVCFWRKEESPSNSLRPGDLFFFLVKNKKQKKGERAILGYGVFQRYEVLDVEEAWKKYTLGNGSTDKSTFISRAKSLSGNKSESFELSCIILSVLQPMPIDQKLTLLPVQKLTDIMTTYKLKKGKRRLCMMCRCANSCTRVVPKNRMIILSNYGLEENRKRGVFR